MVTRKLRQPWALFGLMLFLGCSSAAQPSDGGAEDALDVSSRQDLADATHSDDVAPRSLNSPWSFSDGASVSIRVQRDPIRFDLIRGEAVVWSLDGASFEVGFVPAHDPELSYDPYWLHFSFLGGVPDPPEGLAWGTIASIEEPANVLDDGSIELHVVWTTGHKGSITLGSTATDSVSMTLGFEFPDQVAFHRIRYPAVDGEEFYGLGESFDQVARRGSYRAMQFVPLLNTESGYNEAHVPVPLLISTRGPALLVESLYPMFFDVAHEDPDVVRVEVGQQEPLTVHLIAPSEPIAAIGVYHRLTALPLVPPFWAFAPHYWRNETTGQSEVEQDLKDIRDNDLPAGVFWIDRPYQQNYNDCVFDPARYSDPEAMLDVYRDRGFKLVLWHAPYTSEESDAWDSCVDKGLFIDGPVLFDKFGLMMDFTNPEAVSLWQDLLARFVNIGGEYQGAAGYKLDYAEDIQVGINGKRFDYNFADGSNGLTMHHRYSYLYQKTYLDSLKPAEPRADGTNPHYVDGFVMGRTGSLGGQEVVHAIWPGDLDNSDQYHLEEDYWVGGLPASVVASLTLSASGYPFYAADTGGYRGGRPTGEILVRWAWNTALSAVMQIGGAGSNHFPWADGNEGEPVYDELVLDRVRKATKLNMQLASYRFTWGLHARNVGVPLVRPIGLAYPEDGRHPNDAYLLGPDLLVAPFVRGDDERQVPIPSGRWIEFFEDTVVDGPIDVTVPKTLDAVPLYVRTGAIVPLLPFEVDSLSPSSDPETTSLDETEGQLSYLVVPGEESDYENHDGSRCVLNERLQGGWSVQVVPGARFHNFSLDARYGLSNMELPNQVRLDGVELPRVDDLAAFGSCQEPCVHIDESNGRVQVRLGVIVDEAGALVEFVP